MIVVKQSAMITIVITTIHVRVVAKLFIMMIPNTYMMRVFALVVIVGSVITVRTANKTNLMMILAVVKMIGIMLMRIQGYYVIVQKLSFNIMV
jgi:hypothetical protein